MQKKWCHHCCVARLRVSHPTEEYSQKGEQEWLILIPWWGLHLAWGWVWNPGLFLPEISTSSSPVHSRTAHPGGKQEEPKLEKTFSSRAWDAFSNFYRQQGGIDSRAPHLMWLRYPLGHKDRKELKISSPSLTPGRLIEATLTEACLLQASSGGISWTSQMRNMGCGGAVSQLMFSLRPSPSSLQ